MTSSRFKQWILLALLVGATSSAVTPAQNSQMSKVLVATGHNGEAPVIQIKGRNYVDLDSLAQMLGASLGYQESRIVLALPSSTAPASARNEPQSESQSQAESGPSPAADKRLSTNFVNAAIETLGSMREWAATLALIIKKGYPVGDVIEEYRGRTMKSFALANAAVINDSDRNAMEMLTFEYNNLQAWSDELVKARNSMRAANYAMSEGALLNHPSSQKLLRCWKFLGPMIARGSFEDDGSCR